MGMEDIDIFLFQFWGFVAGCPNSGLVIIFFVSPI
jgi:hypothetical protein